MRGKLSPCSRHAPVVLTLLVLLLVPRIISTELGIIKTLEILSVLVPVRYPFKKTRTIALNARLLRYVD